MLENLLKFSEKNDILISDIVHTDTLSRFKINVMKIIPTEKRDR